MKAAALSIPGVKGRLPSISSEASILSTLSTSATLITSSIRGSACGTPFGFFCAAQEAISKLNAKYTGNRTLEVFLDDMQESLSGIIKVVKEIKGSSFP
jgi:hypothetical protein